MIKPAPLLSFFRLWAMAFALSSTESAVIAPIFNIPPACTFKLHISCPSGPISWRTTTCMSLLGYSTTSGNTRKLSCISFGKKPRSFIKDSAGLLFILMIMFPADSVMTASSDWIDFAGKEEWKNLGFTRPLKRSKAILSLKIPLPPEAWPAAGLTALKIVLGFSICVWISRARVPNTGIPAQARYRAVVMASPGTLSIVGRKANTKVGDPAGGSVSFSPGEEAVRR